MPLRLMLSEFIMYPELLESGFRCKSSNRSSVPPKPQRQISELSDEWGESIDENDLLDVMQAGSSGSNIGGDRILVDEATNGKEGFEKFRTHF